MNRSSGKTIKPEIHGEPTTGRIVRFTSGFGFIRTADGREVFFARADQLEGFSHLALGDEMAFDLVEMNGRLAAYHLKKVGKS
jgi:cold shock CspA family protein